MTDQMKKVEVHLEREQVEALALLAERRSTSIDALVREALQRLLSEDREDAIRHRAAFAVGGFRSGESDISEQHDDALTDSLDW